MKHLIINPRWNLLLPLLLLIAGFAVPAAGAHTEGKMQLSAEPAGPYKLTVWTSPDPAETGEVHIAIAVVLAEDASPVLDADILVVMTAEEGEDQNLSSPATTEDSENKFLYEAVMNVTESNLYQVSIEVIGADGANGSVTFDLEVEGQSGFNWLLIPGIAVVVVAVIILLFVRRRATEG